MPLNKIAVGHRSETTTADNFKKAFAEFIAVFLFVFIGVGSVSAFYKISGNEADLTPAGLVAIAIAHGLGIAITVAATAGISGGHVNPAVTFGLLLGGKITVLLGVLYWIAQFAGGIFAALVLKFVIVTHEPVPSHGLGADVHWPGGLVLEIILTFALVFVVYATAVDTKNNQGAIAPLVIGFTVLAAHFIGVPYTGASLNPARSFGPAVVNWTWEGQWIYLVGPFIGAALATVIYDNVFLSPETGHLPLPGGD